MSVANLTKYAMFGDGDMCAVKDCVDNIQRYVKFEEAMEASSNNIQQLKAEIAAVVKYLEDNHQSSEFGPNHIISHVLRSLRQLSAV